MKTLKELIMGPNEVNFVMVRTKKKKTQRFGKLGRPDLRGIKAPFVISSRRAIVDGETLQRGGA